MGDTTDFIVESIANKTKTSPCRAVASFSMDQKPPQLSVADVKEEAQDVLISDVDGAGHSSPDEVKCSAAERREYSVSRL
nr:uncharacterized protein LOC111836242 isoform X2 [Paramormyrops kingsleyae]